MPITAQQRYNKGRTSRIDQEADHLINMSEVAFRWSVGPIVARRRLEKAHVPLVRFNVKSVEVWLHDLVEFEKKFTTKS